MIAKLNVVIDPSQASSGATAAVQAAKAVKSALDEASKAAGNLGGSFDKMKQQAGNAGGFFKNAFGGMMSAASGAVKGVLAVGAAFGALQAAMLPIMAMVKTLTAAFGLLASSIAGAADFEDYTVQFAQLLGSFDKAEQRMKMLASIAAKTPFNLPEIVKGTITLESLSKGALTTQKNLLMIGDAVAKSKQPFEEMSITIGRLYANVKNGISSAFELNRLIETGVVTDNAVKIRNLMESGNAGGKRAVEIWGLIEQNLKRASGSMELMSRTTNGLKSTMEDAWAGFQRTFGAALNEGLRPIMRMITVEIDTWTEKAAALAPKIAAIAKEVAAYVGAALGTPTAGQKTVESIFNKAMAGTGIQFKPQTSGFATALQAAIDTAMQKLSIGLQAAGVIASRLFENAGIVLKNILNEINQPSFWKGLADALYNAGVDLVNAITGGLAKMENRTKSAIVTGAMTAAVPGGEGTLAKMLGVMVDIKSYFGGSTNTNARVEPPAAPQPVNPYAIPYRTGNPQNAPNPLLPSIAWDDAVRQIPTPQPTQAQLDFARGVSQQRASIAAAPSSRDDSLLAPRQPLIFRPESGDALSKQIEAQKKAKELADDMERSSQRFIAAIQTPAEKLTETLKQIAALEKAVGSDGKPLLSAEQAARARTQAQEDYKKAIDKTTKALEKQQHAEMNQFQRTMEFWGDYGKMSAELKTNVVHSLANNMTNAIVSLVDGTKTAKQAFGDMARAIIADIIQMTTRMLIMNAIAKAFSMGGGGNSGGSSKGSSTGGWLSLIGSILGAILHEGGTVGSSGPTRAVHPMTFANSPRFQHGGVIPKTMGSGETPVIAEPGETMLTRQQSSDIKNRLGKKEKKEAAPVIHIVNVLDPNLVEASLAKNDKVILNIIGANSRTVKQLLAR